MIRLPESVHAALVSDLAVAMALRNPDLLTAISDIAAEERAMEMKRLLATVPDPSLPLFPSTPEDNPNRFVEDVEGKVFRREYCGQFVDPPFSVPCPKCTEGHLVDDTRGRGGRCLKCGYKTWEQGPFYDDHIDSMPMMRSPASPTGERTAHMTEA